MSLMYSIQSADRMMFILKKNYCVNPKKITGEGGISLDVYKEYCETAKKKRSRGRVRADVNEKLKFL